MSETNHRINLALRTAAGHARAANDALAAAEGTYEMKMKSAGASVWEAWKLAVHAQPEFAGRKLDDKALVRIYESTKARPWWDRHLSAVKFAGKPVNREWAKRTLQWHTDPNAARVRRAKDNAVSAAAYKRVKEKREAAATAAAAAQGRQRPQGADREPTTAEMRGVGKAVELGMGYGTQSAPREEADAARTTIDRLVIRIRQAIGRIGDDQTKLAEAEAMLQIVAEGVEAL